MQGKRIVQASWVGTALFTLAAAVAAAVLGTVRYVAVGVDVVLFVLGCAAFLWAYWLAIQRSRYDEIGIGGLYFLAGPTAPRRVRWLLNGSLATQVGVALLTASLRPYTTLAFGLLVPMFGLGCNGLWGARYGRFGPRVHDTPATPSPRTAVDAEPLDAPRPSEIGQNGRHG